MVRAQPLLLKVFRALIPRPACLGPRANSAPLLAELFGAGYSLSLGLSFLTCEMQ